MSKRRIQLGDEVKDSVTGLKGIVTCITLYLNGCTRCGVQPKLGKDGKIPESWFIDEPQLVVVIPNKVKAGNTTIEEDQTNSKPKTGGPMTKAPGYDKVRS